MRRLSTSLAPLLLTTLLVSCTERTTPTDIPTEMNTTAASPLADAARAQAPEIRAALRVANLRLAARGRRVRVAKAEWITRPGSSQAGQTVFVNDRGNKQSPFDFVPGDPGRGGRTNILYLVDQSDGAAVGGLSSAQTEAAIDRSIATWNGVACSSIPIQKAADTGVDPDIVDFLLGVGGAGAINLGPVVTVDVVHAGFLGANFFDALTPGCVPGSTDNPCGSVFILGITFTIGFVDGDGNFTDINNDGQFDAAFREIYYNNADPDANGVTVPWRINAHPDVESVALHEFGHGLSQAHFGKIFATDNGKLHFAPLAVMNAAIVGVIQRLRGSDIGGHCSLWANWPNN